MLVKETHHTVSVRPSDFDVLGHVNNAVVLEFLEMGRAHWLAENNLAVNGCVVAVVARAAVDYRREIAVPIVEVSTVLESPTADEIVDGDLTFRASFVQTIRLQGSAEPAVNALITVAFVSSEHRRLASMNEFLAASQRERSGQL